jgi:hypothetical protein
VCRSIIYQAVTSRELRAKKRGRSTLILPNDLRDWINSFPDFTPYQNNNPHGRPRAAAAA